MSSDLLGLYRYGSGVSPCIHTFSEPDPLKGLVSWPSTGAGMQSGRRWKRSIYYSF